MKRIVLFSFLLVLAVAGAVLGQSGETTLNFEIVSEMGRALPRSILYDPNFERIALVNAYGELELIDALTYETQHVLYRGGSYNDYAFSRDGRWFALAIGTQMELYDANSGELVSKLDNPGGALRIHGPLAFSEDDNLLVFYGTHPAPQSLRRYENDTTITPWIWNLTAARNEGNSTFPNRVEAWQFFDYRNGFVLGPENRIVAALPGRLHVIDAYSLDVLFEIETLRYEQDPMNVWFSVRDNTIYVLPVYEGALIQVDTQRGVLVEIPLGKALTLNDLETLGGVEPGSQARVIGGANSETDIPLLQALLGMRYRERSSFHPLTVTLVDLLTVPATGDDRLQSLLFIYDEETKEGRFVFNRPYNVGQLVLHPDGERLLLRRSGDSGEQVEVYEMDSGLMIGSVVPALRDLGGYSRQRKNRILAYDKSGEIIVSDFQRFEADTYAIVAEDLRYSRRFDQFFFTADNSGIVTLSGNEWRLWSIDSGEVVRREVLALRGSVIATASDGTRFLTQFEENSGPGVEILDADSGETRSVIFTNLRGRFIEQVIPSPDWEHYYVIYSTNSYGPHAPSNEVAIYSMDEGQLWFVAGDDLPPADGRNYGWVDNETAYIYGEGNPNLIPDRVYGAKFAVDGTPACLVERYPAQRSDLAKAWYDATLFLRDDQINRLALTICGQLGDTPPVISSDIVLPTATPVLIDGIPACLTQRYPGEAEAYAAQWREMTTGLSAELMAEMEVILCEGIGTPAPSANSSYLAQTMMLDAGSGERLNGSYNAPANPRPMAPIIDAFSRRGRALGMAILSEDETLVASSSLPGELVVYRLVTTYRTVLSWGTATAAAQYEAENRIAVLPTLTPTYSLIGTAQPTMTPTVTPTPPPRTENRLEQPLAGQIEDICPAETLYTPASFADGYNPPGRLVAPVEGGGLWTINPRTAQRNPDETIPACGQGITCSFSPDRSWILANGVNEIFVVRPDGSDQRVLFDKLKTYPDSIRWSGTQTLEYDIFGPIPGNPERNDWLRQRDVLGVFPDADPLWLAGIRIRGLPVEVVERQPGGSLAVARVTFSTGINPGYEYYIYNTEAGEASYFARLTEYPEQPLTLFWHPLGDRLYYHYPTPSGQTPIWYLFDPASGEHLRVGHVYGGTWSNDGRYRVFTTQRRAQPVGVWDSQSGLVRTYCLPETGARLYEGSFYWSPDSRYIALQTGLPKDETEEGVGQHILILDVESGSVTDLTSGAGALVGWLQDAGTYGRGE